MITKSEWSNLLYSPWGYRAFLDCVRPSKLCPKELPISLKSQTKIFITHFHKTFSFLIKLFLVNLVIFFQITALHTTSHPELTLYPIYNFSVSYIRCINKKLDTHTSTGYIAMVSLQYVFWDDLSTSWKFKKAKCFLCLMVWDGLLSSWAEFLPPGASHPESRGVHAVSSLILAHEFFSFYGHVQHCHSSIIDVA